MRPSVRGAEGPQVVGVLATFGMATGGLAGFAAGVAWDAAGLGRLGAVTAAAITASAVALDVAARVAGGPRPPAVGRQVPQRWGRLLGSRTAAALYGARLGVGPLTILTSWTWWAALLLGTSAGPFVGAGVGASFAVTRIAAMVVVVGRPEDGVGMSRRMAGVRRVEPAVTWASLVVVLGLVVLAAGCAGDDGDAGGPGGGPGAAGRDDDDPDHDGRDEDADDAGRMGLEPVTTTTTTPEDAALAALLLDHSLPGFRRADSALGAGPLDLEAAARAEADVEAERAVLETRGFLRGASRAWLGAGDDVAYVAVYEFGDPDGAAAYTADGIETIEARGATPFEVPGLPGARGFTTVDETGGQRFTAHAVVFSQGPRWVLALVGSDAGRRQPDEARDLATRQAARLDRR